MALSPNPSLYLVDAHSLIFQVFHALPEMTSPAGLPTNALFGFTKDLLHLRTEKQADFLICAFDVPGPTFRDKLYPEYKAQRGPMPDDLQLQISLIYQLLKAMRIPALGVEGFEADDVLATLATAGAAQGMEVFICSGDKDCRQLLGERVKIYNLRKREIFDRAALEKDWGIMPEQVVDLQTLVGDSVDNVPGVPGIGLKTGAQLLQEYGTLDNLLAHVQDLKGKKKENLTQAAPLLERSRSLVRLETKVPIPLDWDSWRVQPWDKEQLLSLFREWGFHGFADRVRNSPNLAAESARREEGEKVASSRKGKSKILVQGNLFGEEIEPQDVQEKILRRDENWLGDYHLVSNEEEFEKFFAQLIEQPRIALDLETTSLDPHDAQIVGLAICWKPGDAWYLALRTPQGEPALDPERTLHRLQPILESERPAKVNQNIKYDLEVLRQHGIRLAGMVGDPMVADYLLHAGERTHSMEVLAEKHLKHAVIPITDLIGTGKNQLHMDQVPSLQVAEYAGEDADVAFRLCDQLEPILQDHGLKKPVSGDFERAGSSYDRSKVYLYDDLEIPLIEVLADMEYTGIRLDVPLLKKLGEEMEESLACLEKEIHHLAGREFNIASVKQLREVLFTQLGLKAGRKTAITGADSTNQETLERLAREGHELPQKLLEHRKIAKLKGTYVDALPGLVHPRMGRIHASFNQAVAATGRLSSSDPNLQNIPIRSEQGEQIRQAFIPEPGWKLLSADYSQIELRLLAHFSGDENMRQAFAEDRDIHAMVASQIFGVPEDQVTSQMRRAAKTVNFGVIYGISAFGLAQRLEISKEEAGKFIDAYFARYPRVLAYQDELLNNCREKGYVSTILGRRRRIQGIRPFTTYKNRNQPEREAVNMEIQGSAADLIKMAMLKIYRRLNSEKRQTRMLLQIHDELVFEVPPEELNEVAALVRQEMTGALADRLQVPLKVDVGVGPNWLEVRDISLGD